MHDPRDILWHNGCEASTGGTLIHWLDLTVAAAPSPPRLGVGTKGNATQTNKEEGAQALKCRGALSGCGACEVQTSSSH